MIDVIFKHGVDLNQTNKKTGATLLISATERGDSISLNQ